MPGILGRFMGGKKLSLAERQKLLLGAVALFMDGRNLEEVEEDLRQAGMPAEESRGMAVEARDKYESDILRTVRLPPSARQPPNYYFLLGVTPRATMEEIRRAYRRKAKIVHPDAHHQEFSREQWAQLMTTIGDAHTVLTDPNSRRAYDVFWRQRSRAIAKENRRKGQVRGDWETRYRWEVARLVEIEEELGNLMPRIQTAVADGAADPGVVAELNRLIESYEGRILDIRTESYSLPTKFERFADQVRREMQRKERWVPQLKRLSYALSGRIEVTAVRSAAEDATEALNEIQFQQAMFDIRAARG
jgi:curved DNA-binding protein CbpA